jgi:hypothetical protein
MPLKLDLPAVAPVVRVSIKAAGVDELHERELASERGDDGGHQLGMEHARRHAVDRPFGASDEIAEAAGKRAHGWPLSAIWRTALSRPFARAFRTTRRSSGFVIAEIPAAR